MSNFETALLIKATLNIYWQSAVSASTQLLKSWIIIPASLGAYLVFLVVASIVSGFGLAGGFVAGIFYVTLLSFYYIWLRSIINKERLRPKNILEFDWSLFSSLISVGFILWIVSLVTDPFATTAETVWLYACIKLALFILLNAVPEVVYIRGYESMQALKYSFNFIRDNWVEWFLPLLILFAPILITQPTYLLLSVAGDPLFPAGVVFSKVVSYLNPALAWIGIIVGIILTNWFMLFRGFLFQKLDGSTRRRRVYQFKNN